MTCTRAPKGWTCSRVGGHVGPCAAHQTSFKVGDCVWVKAVVIDVEDDDSALPYCVKVEDSFYEEWVEPEQIKPREESE